MPDISHGPSLPAATIPQENGGSKNRESNNTNKDIVPNLPTPSMSHTPLHEKQTMPSQLQMGSKHSTRVDLSLDRGQQQFKSM